MPSLGMGKQGKKGRDCCRGVEGKKRTFAAAYTSKVRHAAMRIMPSVDSAIIQEKPSDRSHRLRTLARGMYTDAAQMLATTSTTGMRAWLSKALNTKGVKFAARDDLIALTKYINHILFFHEIKKNRHTKKR